MHEGMPLPAPFPCLRTWATHLDRDLPALPTYAWFSWLLSTQSVNSSGPFVDSCTQPAFAESLLGAGHFSRCSDCIGDKTDKIPRPQGAYSLLGKENNTQAKEVKCIAY